MVRAKIRKVNGLSPTEASELLSLCLLVKPEIDAALGQAPGALVTYIRIAANSAGICSPMVCATTTSSPVDSSGQLILPKTDPRLDGLQFLPRTFELLTRLAGSRQHADLHSMSTPTLVPIASQAVTAEVWCCEGSRLQTLLRDAIAGLVGQPSRFVVTANTEVEDLALRIIRVMRHKAQGRMRKPAASTAESLFHWGIKPLNKKRTQYEIGGSSSPYRTIAGKGKLFQALAHAAQRGWIQRARSSGNKCTYKPTGAGLEAASLTAFLTGLRHELCDRPVRIKGLDRPRRRIVCYARAMGKKRARTWAEDLHPAADGMPAPTRLSPSRRRQRRPGRRGRQR